MRGLRGIGRFFQPADEGIQDDPIAGPAVWSILAGHLLRRLSFLVIGEERNIREVFAL